MPRYNPATVEPKWQQFWEENSTFKAPELPQGDKLYALDMFPYPSGDGLSLYYREYGEADDVVLCLSLSGVSPDVMASAQIAKEYGAHLLAICPEGPLADAVDLHLPIKTQEAEYIFNPSASRYAMLAVIDVLALELAMRHRERSRTKLRRLKLSLDDHRGGDNRQPLGD